MTYINKYYVPTTEKKREFQLQFRWLSREAHQKWLLYTNVTSGRGYTSQWQPIFWKSWFFTVQSAAWDLKRQIKRKSASEFEGREFRILRKETNEVYSLAIEINAHGPQVRIEKAGIRIAAW